MRLLFFQTSKCTVRYYYNKSVSYSNRGTPIKIITKNSSIGVRFSICSIFKKNKDYEKDNIMINDCGEIAMSSFKQELADAADGIDTTTILAALLEISNQSASSRYDDDNANNNKSTERVNEILFKLHDGNKEDKEDKENMKANADKNDAYIETKYKEEDANCSKSSSTMRVTASDRTISAAESFLECHSEKAEMNQYWYSTETIQSLCHAIQELLSTIVMGGTRKRVAFLSTPSLYFAFPLEARKYCCLFDVRLQLAIARLHLECLVISPSLIFHDNNSILFN
jgi:hypothetical protein